MNPLDGGRMEVACAQRERQQRQAFFLNISQRVESFLRSSSVQSNASQDALMCFIPQLLRLRHRAPYEDVREAISSTLLTLEKNKLKIPRLVFQDASCYIPTPQLILADNAHDLARVFACGNLNLTHVLSVHPLYLEAFQDFVSTLNGEMIPIPEDWKCYISLMAASRHLCTYLMRQAEVDFRRACLICNSGANLSWLESLSNAEPKIQALDTLNTLMAHRPWDIDVQHIECLTKDHGWSLSQLAFIIVLMAHIHALSSLVYGCALTPEIDSLHGHSYESGEPLRVQTCERVSEGDVRDDNELTANSFRSDDFFTCSISPGAFSTDDSDDSDVDESVREYLEKMKECDREALSAVEIDNLENLDRQEAEVRRAVEEQEQLRKVQNEIKIKERGSNGNSGFRTGRSAPMHTRNPKQLTEDSIKMHELMQQNVQFGRKLASRFVENLDCVYEDFNKARVRKDAHYTSSQDLNWDDSVSYFADRYCHPGITDALHRKFQIAKTFSYNTFSSANNVDTSSFRRSIWYYVHLIFGLKHDTFNYAHINHLLRIEDKRHVKNTVCYPERLLLADHLSFMPELRLSEKIHVHILLYEARLQAELLYPFRALIKYHRN